MKKLNFKPKFGGNSLFIKNKYAFTLVELIIVVTIIVILATIAFLSFGNYPSQTRDTARKADIKNIEKSLQLYEIKNREYPEPETNSEGEKIFGEAVYKKVGNIAVLPKDPLTKKEYFYEKIGKGYYLKANFENGEEFETFGGELPKTCKEILKFDNGSLSGNYKIFPNRKKIEVYCDMETADENGEKGWTRYLDIKRNYSFEEAKNCWLGKIISNENLSCFNPNYFGFEVEKFMAKQNGQKYFYSLPEKQTPKLDTQSSQSKRSCIGGEKYMTKMHGETSNGTQTYIWLGLNFCSFNEKWGASLGGVTIDYNTKLNVYMNNSSRGEFGPYSGAHRDINVIPVEIYIK